MATDIDSDGPSRGEKKSMRGWSESEDSAEQRKTRRLPPLLLTITRNIFSGTIPRSFSFPLPSEAFVRGGGGGVGGGGDTMTE